MINWFRRRKKEEEDVFENIYSNEVPLTTLVRWFIYDTGHQEDGVDELIGLAPISEEGIEKESQDSTKRIEEINSLVPFIDFISDASSTVFSTIGANLAEGVTDEEREEMEDVLANLYKSIAIHSVIGAFSIANALGLIHITAYSSELGLAGDDYDE